MTLDYLQPSQYTIIDPERRVAAANASVIANAGANAFAHTPNAKNPSSMMTDFCSLTSCLMVRLDIGASIGLLHHSHSV